MRQIVSTILSVGILNLAAFAGPIGQVQLGGATGLTSAYLTGANANGANGCNNIGAAAGNVGCQGTAAGAFGAGALGTGTSDYKKLNYVNNLFSGATGIGTLNSFGAVPNQGTLTDSTLNGGAGVTFNLLNDGLATSGNGNANYWAQTNVNDVLTIPVGVFAVDKVWTMLSETYGLANTNSATIKFLFGTTSNTTNAGSITVQLKSAGSSTAVGATDMLTGVECDPSHLENSGLGPTVGGTAGTCANYGVAGFQATNAAPSAGSAGKGTAWSGTFTSIAGTATPFTGATNGTLTLSDQTFNFANYSAQFSGFLTSYLSEIVIQDTTFCSNSSNCGSNPAFNSRVGVSAITVDSTFDAGSATPEPTTILLFGAGLGGILIARRRRA